MEWMATSTGAAEWAETGRGGQDVLNSVRPRTVSVERMRWGVELREVLTGEGEGRLKFGHEENKAV